MEDIINASQSAESFRKNAHALVDFLAEKLELSQSGDNEKTLNWSSPEDQLAFWRNDLRESKPTELFDLLQEVFPRSVDFHSKRYMGHQVSTPLPLTAITSLFLGYMNNSTTVYELAMSGNSMEKVVIEYLAAKFGYDEASTGIVTSGGSLGNLTALLTARSSLGVDPSEYHTLSILVSEQAHYSVERAAAIMGIPAENIIKVPTDDTFRIRTDCLEDAYQTATSEGKRVFCIVGCSCTTATGAYDDLDALGAFSKKFNLWFHVDGAHGGAVIFSDKYKSFLRGVEQSDSLALDFHKMMLVPSLSTAVIFNARNRKAKSLTPKADYLWQDPNAEEWYNSAKHTLECTKPMTILHTYAILRLFGDKVYQEHVDKLYDLGKRFGEMIQARDAMELAVFPDTNIVCFRFLAKDGQHDAFNKKLYDAMLKDGDFYLVNTTARGEFYHRVALMNTLTDAHDLSMLLDKMEDLAKRI